jgi:uncharacterized membrane protein YpjA
MSPRGWAAGVADRVRYLLDSDVPREDLPWYVAPLPERVENLGLNLAWLIVAINLAGTAFGFYYYLPQFSSTPVQMWPFVPDSPLATLFIALALAAWKLDRHQEWLTALAFFGNLLLGGWTVYVHLAFFESFGYLHPAMRQFLIWSHAAMVLQAFLLHRIADFRPWAICVATLWYTVNASVDYFIPVLGDPHHTLIPLQRDTQVGLGADALGVAGAGAFVLLVVAVYLAMLTHIETHPPADDASTISTRICPERSPCYSLHGIRNPAIPDSLIGPWYRFSVSIRNIRVFPRGAPTPYHTNVYRPTTDPLHYLTYAHESTRHGRTVPRRPLPTGAPHLRRVHHCRPARNELPAVLDRRRRPRRRHGDTRLDAR